jgi:POT family proton-dependent oligopeptide transporter
MWNIVVAVGLVITLVTIIPVILQMRQHPRGLHILFFAEMWERFSYYGMRGILLAYMTQHFLFADRQAAANYASYTSLVYLLPLVGGFLADKYLGNRKAIAFGALLLVAGHLSMAIEQKPAQEFLQYQGRDYAFVSEGFQDQRKTTLEIDGARYAFGPAESGGIAIAGLPAGASLPAVLPEGSYTTEVRGRDPVYVSIFFAALALIIMGVGLLKASISSIVGQLYEKDDPRRDSGFTLYYYGINLGAFWASILCAGLGATVGWWAGFGLAGIGMLLGWLVFVRGRFLFFTPGEGQLPKHVGAPPEPEKLKAPLLGPLNREQLIYLGALAGVAVIWFLIQQRPLVFGMLVAGSVIVLAYIFWFMATRCTKIEAQRLALALVFVAAATVFWTLFELGGTALNQFAERNTQLPSDGFLTITSGQTQSFNAGFILLLAPIFAATWAYLEKRRQDPNDVMKFSLALVQVGASFLLLVFGAQYADENFRVPLIFLAGLYFLQTTGELMLSPVGLSAITKLAPIAVLSTMMATWFLSSSWAQMLGGFITERTAQETLGGQVLDPGKALATYVEVFNQIGWGAIAIGVGLGALSFWLKKLAHREH